MSDDPQTLAGEVVLDALRERPDLFVAMHYLGLIDGSALATPDRIDPQADKVLVIAEQITPVYQPPPTRPLHQVVADTARWQPKRTRSTQESRSQFARWVDGEITYHPNVLGWPDTPGNWPRES